MKPNNTLEEHGHHMIDRAELDEDGFPYKHLDDPRINDGDLPTEPVVYKDGYSAECPF